MYTTLEKIKLNGLERGGFDKLLKYLGKTEGDDEPLTILKVLDSNGYWSAIWSLKTVDGDEKAIRRFALWCACEVRSLLIDNKIIGILDVAERHTNSQATNDELDSAIAKAYGSSWKKLRELEKSAHGDSWVAYAKNSWGVFRAANESALAAACGDPWWASCAAEFAAERAGGEEYRAAVVEAQEAELRRILKNE